jgi:hypothetical protein
MEKFEVHVERSPTRIIKDGDYEKVTTQERIQAQEFSPWGSDWSLRECSTNPPPRHPPFLSIWYACLKAVLNGGCKWRCKSQYNSSQSCGATGVQWSSNGSLIRVR